jgi:hypothetical protein
MRIGRDSPVGWVKQESRRLVAGEFGMMTFDQTWEVWLNVADGRVWLKAQS